MTGATAALVVAGWLAATVLGWRHRRVDDVAVGDVAIGAGTISVVIPARDEARRLPALLASLQQQHRPADEVLVVDDGSSDGTADVAAAAGATVLQAPPPPDGWAGKPWACHLGTEAARGDLLVLLDADTTLAADALERLAAAHRAGAEEGLLSVQPHHRVERPYEQLSLLANVVAVLASGMFAARLPRRSAVAFGPCLVARAAHLRAVGGFAGVRGDVLEDVALARVFAAADRPVRCLAGGTTVAFRMYPHGWRALVEGWTKNLAGGARQAPRLPALAAALWVAALCAVSVEAWRQPTWAAAVAWAVSAAQLGWLARRVGTFRWWAWAVFPVPVAAFVALFVRSLVSRGIRRRVRWRGRELAVGGG